MGFNIRQLLGGVGLLIFGMNLLEHALYLLGGNKLKHFLQHHTGSMWLAVPVGWFTTLLMSGSGDLVTLLTMALVSAGLIKMRSGLGIIFGSNIGATSLPLIVALFGFGKFDFGEVVLPLIALGGVMLLIFKSEKTEQIAKALIGFSLLFIAIQRMGSSIAGIENSFDIAKYRDMSLRGFGLLGAILAAIIQSGGAIGIITLTALQSDIITFASSVAIMMGVNIGTTNTPLIAAFGGRRDKLQIGISHVLFNVVSGIIGVVFFRQYIWVGKVALGLEDNLPLANASINFIFNASTAILFACLVGPFERLVKRIVPNKEETKLLETEELMAQTNQIAYTIPFVISFRKDTRTFVSEVITLTENRMNDRMINALVNKPLSGTGYDVTITEKHIQKSKLLLSLAVELQRKSKNPNTIEMLDLCKLSVRQCYQVLQLIKRTDVALQRDIIHLPDSLPEIQDQIINESKTIMKEIHSISDHQDSQPVIHITNALTQLKSLRLNVLKLLIKNVSENQKSDETLSEMIIFTQRLYQIIKKILTALRYAFLLKSEQDSIDYEIE